MRIATAIGLVLAIVVGLLVVGQVSDLQLTASQSTSGAVQGFFNVSTTVVLAVVGVLALGTLVAFVAWILRQ